MKHQLHTPVDQKEATREPSDTGSPGPDTRASHIASPRTTRTSVQTV